MQGTVPRGRRALRLLFSVLLAALALAALEGALALLGLPRDPTPAPGEGLVPATELDDPRLFERDPVLLWRLRRSAVLDVPEDGYAGVRTNAAGLRGAELPPPGEHPGEIRVLCLGDSVTFGLGLAEGETYPDRLGARLRALLPGKGVRVVNGGVPGYSLLQGSRLFEELAPLRPDAVVCWFGANDAKPAMGVPDARLNLPDAAASGLTAALEHLRLFRCAAALVRPRQAAQRRSTPAETGVLAGRLQGLGAERGARVLFVRGPVRFAEKERQLDRILATVRAEGAQSVDGALRCLSIFVPGPAGGEALGKVQDGPGGRVAFLAMQPGPRISMPVSRLEALRAELGTWKSEYEGHLAALPGDSISPEEVLGPGLPQETSVSDNVHLTRRGAAQAGEGIAKAVLRALRLEVR